MFSLSLSDFKHLLFGNANFFGRFCHMVIIVSAVQRNASIAHRDECYYITGSRSSAGGFPLSYKVSVIALLILTMVIVALLIARW